jgi:hypothetical protein
MLQPGEGSILLVAALLPHRSHHGVGIPPVPTHENDVGIVAATLSPLGMTKTVDCPGYLAAIWMNHSFLFAVQWDTTVFESLLWYMTRVP